VEQAAGSAQVAFRKLLATVEHPRLGEIPLIEQPVHFSDAPRGRHAPPPLLGEHSEAVLGELLGIDRAEIEALRRDGVI
jgi:crotonobetainyl-CoA:carnitine CoA-transferase CaiB-like acyl-CoA transferase